MRSAIAGAQLPDRGGRPRSARTGLGHARSGRSGLVEVLRGAGAAALRAPEAGERRRGALDRIGGQALLPSGRLCLDPFHVVAWATDALDQVRREVWNAARRTRRHGLARELKGARFALWKNPENLTRRQEAKLASIAISTSRCFAPTCSRSTSSGVQDRRGLARSSASGWSGPAVVASGPSSRSRKRSVVTARTSRHAGGLSNALVESVNTKIRLLTRIAFGFHSAEALISLAMLALGGLCPPLPGRAS